MPYTQVEKTKVALVQKYKVFYERKKILGGLISWWVKVKVDKIGRDLVINTAEKYDSIIINGKKINQGIKNL